MGSNKNIGCGGFLVIGFLGLFLLGALIYLVFYIAGFAILAMGLFIAYKYFFNKDMSVENIDKDALNAVDQELNIMSKNINVDLDNVLLRLDHVFTVRGIGTKFEANYFETYESDLRDIQNKVFRAKNNIEYNVNNDIGAKIDNIIEAQKVVDYVNRYLY